MKRTFTVFSLLAALFCFSTFSNDKIVGGRKVESLDITPYIVFFNGCGGSIINDQWVLSAAHCKSVLRKSGKAGVLDHKKRGIKLRTQKVFIHPKYSWSKNNYDFALVKLKRPINFKSTNLKAIKLSDSSYADEGFQDPGTDATIYGWGYTSEGGRQLSRHLNQVTVPIVSNETANRSDSYNGALDETMIAAGLESGGKDSCQGDSGGPMVTFNESGEPVLVGVVSWGHGCARAKKYGVYARVSHVHDWIVKTISDN